VKKLYHKRLYKIPFKIKPIPNGFMMISRAGAGRRANYKVFFKIDDELKEVFDDAYDIVELLYYRGYDRKPHLFCSEIYSIEKPNGANENVAYTHVYAWDKKSKRYILIKKIRYDKNTHFSDRFKAIENKTPRFCPHRLYP